MNWLDRLNIGTVFLIALTLGLAPFAPEPHVWEKLKMLVDGSLAKPIDIFDLFLHGIPWLLLIIKLARMGLQKAAR